MASRCSIATGIFRLGRSLLGGRAPSARSYAGSARILGEGSGVRRTRPAGGVEGSGEEAGVRGSQVRLLGTVQGGGSMREHIEGVRHDMESEGKRDSSEKGPRGHWGNGTASFADASAKGDVSPSGYSTGMGEVPGLMGASLCGVPLEQRLSSFEDVSTQGEGGRPLEVMAMGLKVGLRVVGEETGGAYSVMDYEVPPGEGSYVHVHEKEQEGWYLVEGRMTWQVGDRIVEARPGDFMHMNIRTPHAFRNETNEHARMIVTCVPSGLEGFFMEVGTPITAGGDAVPSEKPVLSSDDIRKAIEAGKRFGLEYPQGFQHG